MKPAVLTDSGFPDGCEKMTDTIAQNCFKNLSHHVDDADNRRLQKGVKAAPISVRLDERERRALKLKAESVGKPVGAFAREIIVSVIGGEEL
jgi:hypothetical protein